MNTRTMFLSTLIVSLFSVSLGWAQEPPLKQPAEQEKPKTGPQPKLVVKKPSLDLGEAKEGAVVDAVFVLENRGDADLKIDNIRASCGCTTVKLTEEEKTIPPGGAQKLVAKFNTKGRAGPQTKTVQVFTNDPEQPQMTLRFTANVQNLVQLLPNRYMGFGAVRRGELVARTLKVLPSQPGASLDEFELELPPATLTYTKKPYTAQGDRRQQHPLDQLDRLKEAVGDDRNLLKPTRNPPKRNRNQPMNPRNRSNAPATSCDFRSIPMPRLVRCTPRLS